MPKESATVWRLGLTLTLIAIACSQDDGLFGPSALRLPNDAHIPVSEPHLRFHDSLRVVVRDSANWAAVWQLLHDSVIGGAPPLPTVDFAQDMVLVVTLGYRPTLGYGVRIDAAGLEASGYHVFVRRFRAGSRCGTLQTPTYPADLVRVPLTLEPVTFLERSVILQCE